MSTDAKILNEWIRVLPQFHDPMNDYRPGTLWLDTDSGTYGDARTLVLINTTEWSAEDHDAWDCMTDSERGSYGVDYVETRGKSVGPLEYQRETGGQCENCDTGDHAEYVVITNGGERRICEACHND